MAEGGARRGRGVLVWLVCGMAGSVMAAPDLSALAREVEAAERSFARSMAERDHAAFRKLSGG